MSFITFDVFQNGFNSKSTWNFIQKAIKKLCNGGNSNQQVGGHFSKSMSLIPTRYFITLSTATANRQKVLEQTDIPENGLICHKVCTSFFLYCEILKKPALNDTDEVAKNLKIAWDDLWNFCTYFWKLCDDTLPIYHVIQNLNCIQLHMIWWCINTQLQPTTMESIIVLWENTFVVMYVIVSVSNSDMDKNSIKYQRT